jgi:hypothetical protein
MGWQQRFIKLFLIILRVAIKTIYQLLSLSHQLFDYDVRLVNQFLRHTQRIIKLCWTPTVNTPVFAVHCSRGHLHALMSRYAIELVFIAITTVSK